MEVFENEGFKGKDLVKNYYRIYLQALTLSDVMNG